MEVVTHSSLPVSSLLWQTRPGAWVLTFVAKATLQLQPGTSPLADSQEPIHEEDSHWDDDPGRSLYAPNDLEPLKQRVDVLLVGSAFAPQGQPVRSLFARLIVGDIEKIIEVHQERSFAADGSLVDGPRFARMSLSYERAAGGPDTSNPIGVRFDARDMYGRARLPNLQLPGLNIASPTTPIAPIGFGPVAPTWPSRWAKLGRHAASWAPGWLRSTPVPEDLDGAYFNAAPADQQLPDLPEDARILLENLHPQIPRLVTSLPPLHLRAVLDGRGGHHPLKMRCDTLWIDTDQGIATMTFRGQLALERIDEPGHIVIVLEETLASSSSAGPPSALTRPSIPMPESPPPQRRRAPTLQPLEDSVADPGPPKAHTSSGLPFLPTAPAPMIREERPYTASALPFGIAPQSPQSQGGLPFAPKSHTSSTSWPAVQAPSALPPAVVPPPPPAAVPLPPAAAPARVSEDSVWASGMSRVEIPKTQSIGQMISASQPTSQEGYLPSPPAVAPAAPPRREPDRGARLDTRQLLHLLWFKPEVAPRICRVPVWRAILDELEQIRTDEAYDAPSLADDPAETEDTRDIFDILARGASQDVDQIEAELAAAVRPGGKFVPPLLLLAGELEFPFDERETLKAVVAVASQVVGTDDVLKNALREARDFFSAAELCPPPIVEGHTARLREAFGRSRRSLPPEVFENQVERALLEGRHYQKRQVLGMMAIRALLHSATSTAARPAPVYLPEDLARKLPMYNRFRTRMIAELYLQEDQYEQHPGALKAYALGRVQASPERK